MLHTSQPSTPNRFISLVASGVTSLPSERECWRELWYFLKWRSAKLGHCSVTTQTPWTRR